MDLKVNEKLTNKNDLYWACYCYNYNDFILGFYGPLWVVCSYPKYIMKFQFPHTKSSNMFSNS